MSYLSNPGLSGKKVLLELAILLFAIIAVGLLYQTNPSRNERLDSRPKGLTKEPHQEERAAPPRNETMTRFPSIAITSYQVIAAKNSYNISLAVAIRNPSDVPLTINITALGIKNWTDFQGVQHDGFAGKLVTLEANYSVRPNSELSFTTFSPVYDVPTVFRSGFAFFSVTSKEHGEIEGTTLVTITSN